MVSSDKLREDFPKNNEKTAGGIMKPKRLTMIFFSIMMLAATPRVMSHFNNYADALHQKVEAEWLNFLLGFAAPADIENDAALLQNSNQSAFCTKGPNKDIEPATVKSRPEAKATPSSLVSKNRAFEFTLTQSTLSGKSKAVRTLIRELTALTKAKTPTVGTVPVSFEKDIVQPSESDPDVANQETSSGHVSSDESMR